MRFPSISDFLSAMVLAVLLATQGPVRGQAGVWELPVATYQDAKRIVLSPARFTGKDWLWAGGAASLTALCFVVDEPVQQWSQGHQSTLADGVATYVGEPLGNSLYMVGGSFALYATGKLLHNENIARPALTAFKATLIAGGAAGVIKLLSHRARPFENNPADAFDWNGPSFSVHSNVSFVSSHSATAFALASSLSTYYKDQRWLPWVSYPLATITAWSRVYHNKHWVSDVVGGAVLGIFIGKTVAQPEKYQWSMVPNRYGGSSVSFTYHF